MGKGANRGKELKHVERDQKKRKKGVKDPPNENSNSKGWEGTKNE